MAETKEIIIWSGIIFSIIISFLGYFQAEQEGDSFVDDTTWISLTQKLNSTGDIDENISIVSDGYIINNGSHILIGSS